MSADGSISNGVLTPERARALAEEILARPEYAAHRREPTFLQNWVDALAAWLEEAWEFLTDLAPDWLVAIWDALWSGLGSMAGAMFGGSGLSVLGRLLLAAAVIGAIGILVHRLLREVRARRPEADDQDSLARESGPELIADAARHASEGRYLEAAHCTQLASLQMLLQKKRLELERSDPNRTLRRRLADAPVPATTRDHFLSLLDRLESHWFRDREDDRDLYGEWRSLHAQIEALPELR
jgi:hypothetical protein